MQQIPPIPELSHEHVKGARLYANRRDAIEVWPRNGRIAEIGVAFGDFSENIFNIVRPELFDAYDLFQYHKSEVAWGRSSAETFKGETHREYYEKRFADRISVGQLRVFEGDSAYELAKRDREFYDVIYIDAGHTYKDVKRDADVAIHCLKSDGLLVFNDYILFDHLSNTTYGVIPVVNQLCVASSFRVYYFALQKDMFCDIALVRS